MTRHKHADVMIAYAEDSSLEIEFTEGGIDQEWRHVDNPAWLEYYEYRIKPKPHKWQHLIDIQKEYPDTVFEFSSTGGEWTVIHHPNFDSLFLQYRVKPKSVTLHQYIYKEYDGKHVLTNYFYETIAEAQDGIEGGGGVVIGPAPWTAYVVEE